MAATAKAGPTSGQHGAMQGGRRSRQLPTSHIAGAKLLQVGLCLLIVSVYRSRPTSVLCREAKTTPIFLCAKVCTKIVGLWAKAAAAPLDSTGCGKEAAFHQENILAEPP